MHGEDNIKFNVSNLYNLLYCKYVTTAAHKNVICTSEATAFTYFSSFLLGHLDP
jgi:hypothetical protein